MFIVLTLDQTFAQRKDDFRSIVGELENLVQHVINDPYVAFWIVRTNEYLVRPSATGTQVAPSWCSSVTGTPDAGSPRAVSSTCVDKLT